jgi:hypothetical protein
MNRSVASIIERPARLAWRSASLQATRAAQLLGARRLHPELVFNGGEYRVRVQPDVGDHVGEEGPLGFGNAQEEMLAVDRVVAVSPGRVDGSIHDTVSALAELARGNIEITDVHVRLRVALFGDTVGAFSTGA